MHNHSWTPPLVQSQQALSESVRDLQAAALRLQTACQALSTSQAAVLEQAAGFEALVAGWSRPAQSHLQGPQNEALAKAAAEALLLQELSWDAVEAAAAALQSKVHGLQQLRLQGPGQPLAVVVASAHRLHNETRSHLLRLPTPLLESVLTHAGPHVRLTCSRLCHTYGAPGTGLVACLAPKVWTMEDLQRTSAADPTAPPVAALLNTVCGWRWRPHLKSLELPPDLVLHPSILDLISAAHPHLRALACATLATTRPFSFATDRVPTPPPTPLNTLTSLTLTWPPLHLGHLVAFAPNLWSLVVFSERPFDSHPEQLASLAALPLRHLAWPLGNVAPVYIMLILTLRSLTLLTHLTLHVPKCSGDSSVDVPAIPMDARQPLLNALTSLPKLVSLSLELPRRLGHNTRPTLESLTRLTALQLIRHPSSYVPDVAAMSSLRCLTLDWMSLDDELSEVMLARPPATNLQALSISLEEGAQGDTQLALLQACLHHFPALTALTTLHPAPLAPDEGESDTLLDRLCQLPGLQRLHMDVDLWGGPRWYSELTTLTSLQLVFAGTWYLEDADLEGLRALTGLRELAIRDNTLTHEEFVHVVMAALQLPHLESLDLGSSTCWEQLERALLPPPTVLRRVVFVPPAEETGAYLERVAELEAGLRLHRVDVVVRRRRWSLCSLGAN